MLIGLQNMKTTFLIKIIDIRGKTFSYCEVNGNGQMQAGKLTRDKKLLKE